VKHKQTHTLLLVNAPLIRGNNLKGFVERTKVSSTIGQLLMGGDQI
jgi:hypothetical protein